ncbi:uncharacterized protein LOC121736696 [Aricia agestis]|uniref:uncharacterized protein LOC121736696 n=1 Tax=Aricia agestis TaxID=91739 RepID=UPI001C20961B|nr:uncharacterized protein LOC121736696 [Aricia agestis]
MQWIVLILLIGYSQCSLWKDGIVHYTINTQDYDAHSQDIIQKVLSSIQNETCVKFFIVDGSANATYEKLLYISNPEKRKTCPPATYDYTKNIINMPIGYKCLNRRDIARITVDMLRASIDNSVTPINSYDLLMRFKEKNKPVSSLLSTPDRSYINAHYHHECEALSKVVGYRRSLRSSQLSEANAKYYEDKIWPLAIVLYGVDVELRGSGDYEQLMYAMTTIQRLTCVVFQEVNYMQPALPQSVIWFAKDGASEPRYGFYEEKQTVSLSSMVRGAAGHSAHALNNLLRALGLHMMSNRYDRDNYVVVNWRNIQTGKEIYFEKAPEEAWVGEIPYDFASATHAPANYMCDVCDLGDTTVQPIQDPLWQRTMLMGHTQELSDADLKLINILYSKQCSSRLS